MEEQEEEEQEKEQEEDQKEDQDEEEEEDVKERTRRRRSRTRRTRRRALGGGGGGGGRENQEEEEQEEEDQEEEWQSVVAEVLSPSTPVGRWGWGQKTPPGASHFQQLFWAGTPCSHALLCWLPAQDACWKPGCQRSLFLPCCTPASSSGSKWAEQQPPGGRAQCAAVLQAGRAEHCSTCLRQWQDLPAPCPALCACLQGLRLLPAQPQPLPELMPSSASLCPHCPSGPCPACLPCCCPAGLGAPKPHLACGTSCASCCGTYGPWPPGKLS